MQRLIIDYNHYDGYFAVHVECGNPQATSTRLRVRNVDFSFRVIVLSKRPVLWGKFYSALNKA